MKIWKRLLLLSLILILAVTIFGCGSKQKQPEKEVKVKKIPVEAIEVKQGTFTKAIILSGTTSPRATITVLPKIQGAEKVVDLKVEVGDKVRKGQTIALLDQSSIALNLNLAKSTYEDTLKKYERNKVLLESGAIPKTALEQVELALTQAQNSLETAQLAYDNTIIKAPLTGIVTAVPMEEGALASAQTPIATIADIDTLEVKTSVNELQVNKIKQGEKVDVLVPAVGNEIFTGRVKNISAVMDDRIKAYPLEISIDNKDNKIKAGMYAELEIITEKHPDVLLIPAQAVISRAGENKVYVVQGEKAVLKMVEIGLSNGEQTEILAGLKKGEQVITKGNEDVVDGDLVTVVNRGEK